MRQISTRPTSDDGIEGHPSNKGTKISQRQHNAHQDMGYLLLELLNDMMNSIWIIFHITFLHVVTIHVKIKNQLKEEVE